MSEFTSKVSESSKELSSVERIKAKDTTRANRIDELTQVEDLHIVVDSWVVLSIHNDKADDPDYENYVLTDTDGARYVTGSKSFWRAFRDIWDEMLDDETMDAVPIVIYRVESKNYKGKTFISCSLDC